MYIKKERGRQRSDKVWKIGLENRKITWVIMLPVLTSEELKKTESTRT